MTIPARLAVLGSIAVLAAACSSAATPPPSTSAAPTQATAPSQAASPAPATPAPATAAPSASAAGGVACGQDLSAISATMKSQEVYAADGTMQLTMPMDAVDVAATPLAVIATLRMEHQKPASDTVSVAMTLPGIGDFTSKTITIGTDEWSDQAGTGAWVHKTVDPKAASDSDIFASLAKAGLAQVDPSTVSSAPDLPGSGCLIAFSGKATSTELPTSSLDMTQVSTVLFRIAPDGRVESAAFLFDPKLAAAGTTPVQFTLTFDYSSPVSIAAPDPAKVTEESPAP